MVGVACEAGHHFGVSRLHRARGAAQRDDAACAAKGHMVEPARREAEMLCQPDRRVRCEREAGNRQAIDVVLLQSTVLEEIGKASRQPPMRRPYGVAHIRNSDRHCNGDPFVAASTHRGHLRRLRSRRSKQSAGSSAKSASFAFCTLLVEVTGSSARKATWPGALK